MTPCWDAKGNGLCGCGKTGPDSVQVLRALGWHYGCGVTIGGAAYEVLLCPACAKDEKRRVVTKSTLPQDEIPFDWEQFKAVPKSQGGHTR